MSDTGILAETERFLAEHRVRPTTFGRRAVGDANLIDDLRAGRELRRATEAKVRAFMASYVRGSDDDGSDDALEVAR
ncbi:MAG: hypothetical protein NDI74_14855 [Sphingomonas sp.]|jgi:hypothetical protein|uniref:hypothetical protein n=1 Tax=Sphingomonas TaxID=13687 RepID=UPI0009D99063|nr:MULTISPECIES: hypothetical protein [Sphingomonas]ATI56779.1 hypothetical protein CP552_14120 [Sphingomonas melonis]MBX8846364.1 hypothetical protein [Sphingomonas melonis]MBX8855467.1 hypothetical protein [Sphingomonas melonis]MBX8900376.1 hypothetical protein [Sphingomonas melonis]MCM2300688.1 hypothetical protein [Sphingomonas sp.]